MTLSTRHASVVFAAVAVSLLVIQLLFLDAKFPVYHPTERYPYATLLRTFGYVRIGVIRGFHGAVFVRIPAGQPVTTALPEDETGEVRRAMLRDLTRTPTKLVAEYAVYLGLFFGTLYLLPRFLAERFRRSRLRWCWALGLSFFAATAIAQIPLLFGYDTSIFSTWAGPGGVIYSTGHLWISHVSGYSVSYRTFLECLLLPALKLLIAAGLLPVSEGRSFWFVSTAEISGFYALLGAFLGAVADLVRVVVWYVFRKT